jgi:hypothetical protein
VNKITSNLAAKLTESPSNVYFILSLDPTFPARTIPVVRPIRTFNSGRPRSCKKDCENNTDWIFVLQTFQLTRSFSKAFCCISALFTAQYLKQIIERQQKHKKQYSLVILNFERSVPTRQHSVSHKVDQQSLSLENELRNFREVIFQHRQQNLQNNKKT